MEAAPHGRTASTEFFSASSASPASSGPSPAGSSASGTSSVDSGRLEALLLDLRLAGSTMQGRRRFVVDSSGSEGDSPGPEAAAAAAAAAQAGTAAQLALTPPLAEGSATAVALPPACQQQQQQPSQGVLHRPAPTTTAPCGSLAAAPPGAPSSAAVLQPAVDVIDLVSSSGSDSEGGWRIAAQSTQRKRTVVESDSELSSSPSPPSSKGLRTEAASSASSAAAAAGTQEAPTPLAPYFAAIGIPLQRPAQPQPPAVQQPSSAAAARHAAAAAGVPSRPAAPQPPAAAKARAAAAAAAGSAALVPARPRFRSAAAFKKQREELALQLFAEFNSAVFDGQLPADLAIRWNNRLGSTAGLTHYRRDIPDDPYELPIYSAHVELSSKVLDDVSKLERTLCHELCHVAAWLVDHIAKPPHGPVFRTWAARAMAAYPHLDITTCHQYEIFYPFRWQCTTTDCLQVYGRHSNSIDVAKKVCGECRGRLAFLGRFQADGTPAKSRAPTAFSQFVKDNYAQENTRALAGTPSADIMKKLAARWAAQQQAGGKGQVAGGSSEGGQGGGGEASQLVVNLLEELELAS